MRLTLIHTADWQLGRPFARFPADIASRLAAARLDAIDRIAETAQVAAARHVVVAGDVFDSERVEAALVRAAAGRMAAYPALHWHLLPGNHDPARPGGVWARLVALGVPANIRLHLAAAPVEIEPGVVLLPAPLAAKSMHSDPTAWMDACATPAGAIRIGLAHGSVQGFGSLGEAPVPIAAGRRRSAGLDYLALGDWHGVKEIAPGVWYAGTPEPDTFADNEPGHVLRVDIAGPGATPSVEVVRTASCRWLARRLHMARLADLAPVEAEIARLGPGASRHLLELRLAGTIGAGELAALDERLAALAARLMHLDRDQRCLATTIAAGDLDGLGRDGDGLAAVARRLGARAERETADGATGDGRVASRAVQILLTLATRSAEAGSAP